MNISALNGFKVTFSLFNEWLIQKKNYAIKDELQWRKSNSKNEKSNEKATVKMEQKNVSSNRYVESKCLILWFQVNPDGANGEMVWIVLEWLTENFQVKWFLEKYLLK